MLRLPFIIRTNAQKKNLNVSFTSIFQLNLHYNYTFLYELYALLILQIHYCNWCPSPIRMSQIPKVLYFFLSASQQFFFLHASRCLLNVSVLVNLLTILLLPWPSPERSRREYIESPRSRIYLYAVSHIRPWVSFARILDDRVILYIYIYIYKQHTHTHTHTHKYIRTMPCDIVEELLMKAERCFRTV